MPKRAPQFWTLLTYGLPVAIFVAVLFAQAPEYASGQKKPKIPPQAKRNSKRQSKPSSATNLQTAQPKSPFDGESAYEFLKQVVAIGPRISATKGMAKQQELITRHFEGLGATVQPQNFLAMHPHLRQQVQLSNLMVRFHPERTARILICCHYDTRPFPDQDPKNPQGVFLGANDGASGVALLCELGKHMPKLEGKFGVDFVFFDGEEFVFVNRRDPMFLGSTHFANMYRNRRINANYSYGILVDMIADKELEILYERNSMDYAPRLTRSIWGVAQRLKIKEFVPRQKHRIRDDHLPLNTIAGIRTCDIIDFDYPNPKSKNAYWHTEQDIVENCSADSLEKVGWVLLEWLTQMQKLNKD